MHARLSVRATALAVAAVAIASGAVAAIDETPTLEGVCAEITTDDTGRAECLSIVSETLGADVRYPANLRRPVVEYVLARGILRAQLEDISLLPYDQDALAAAVAAQADFITKIGEIMFPPDAQSQADALVSAMTEQMSALEGLSVDAPLSDEYLALANAKDQAALALANALGIGVPVSEWADEYCRALDDLQQLMYRYEALLDGYRQGTWVDLPDANGGLAPVRTMLVQAEYLRLEAPDVIAELAAVPDTAPPAVRAVVNRTTPVAEAMLDVAQRTVRVADRVKTFRTLKDRLRTDIRQVGRLAGKASAPLRRVDRAYPSLCTWGGGVNED